MSHARFTLNEEYATPERLDALGRAILGMPARVPDREAAPISSETLDDLSRRLQDLQVADPDLVRSGHGEGAELRRDLRLLSCVVYTTTDWGQLVAEITALAGDNLSYRQVEEILDGHPHETPVAVLQECARLMLEEGATIAAATAQLGVTRDIAENVSTFLRIQEQRRRVELRKAFAAIETGQSARAYATEHGIDRGAAATMFREARAAFGVPA